jgi:hypothetical protein
MSKVFHTAAQSPHVVAMTLDHTAPGPLSVATCCCGWRNAVPPELTLAQDIAVHQHWQTAGLTQAVGHA